MLQFILGASGTGKTTYINTMLQNQSADDSKKIMLIVPEQFTYETEKALFKQLGAKAFRGLTVTSFSRLATDIFKLYGGVAGEYASDCAKIILMDMAVNEVADTLEIYQKASKSKTFSSTMLDMIGELKNAGVSPQDLYSASLQTTDYLNKKTTELSLIYQAYDALLESTYLDSLDNISRATKKLVGTGFFSDYIVYFDSFKGFTANENDLIKMIFSSAKEVQVSLCLDLERANESDVSVFASVKSTYEKLTRFARQSGIKIAPPVVLTTQKRFNSQELSHLEQNIFSPVISKYEGENNNIQAVLCKNEYDEVDFTMAKILELVQQKGYRYDDIVIISRDLETYMPKLELAFEKYNIAYYADSRAKVTTKPLIRFISSAISCINTSFDSEEILSLLKCRLTKFSVEEISELENYVYIWGVKGRQWFSPFVANPRGYKESFMNEDTETLERINTIREYITTHLSALSEGIKGKTGRKICEAIIIFLNNLEIKENTQGIIDGLENNEKLEDEYLYIWDILVEIIDVMAVTIGETAITPKRFAQLYTLISDTYTMGTLPQCLDCVIVGNADRIRTTSKKAVFVLGVNENVMPSIKPTSGIFTDKERAKLIALDVEIAPPTKERILEERFIAYQTLCSPTEKLFLTARKADIAGKEMSPSIIFAQLKKMFSEEIVTDTQDLDGLLYCKNTGSAFSFLAKSFFDDTALNASLKLVLGENQLYQKKIESLEKVANKGQFEITDTKNAKKLFGQEMNISPTRIEGFYQCHFKYFLQHGLRVYPLKKAELNPLETGNMIHSVIYSISKQVDFKKDFNEEMIKGLIKQELDLYIKQVMGGVEDKTKRFLYLYSRMRLSILKVIQQLYNELSQSEFSPCDYEYEISEQSDVTPLVLSDENGTKVTVAGKIDRVDKYINKNGEKYIRIVDYKSGKKEFKLNDVLYGLNLQMLIYLSCISQNGRGSYANSLPAGILYMPAGSQSPKLDRSASQNDIDKEKEKFFKMNGLLLKNDEVLNAMDKDISGVFIPVVKKKDGDFSSASINSLVTLGELGKINSYINKLVLNMATELHQGKVEALPLQNSCDYCDYSGVCGVDSKQVCREYVKFDREEVIKQMGINDMAEEV